MTSNAAIPPLPLEHCRFAVVDVETTGTKAPPAGGGRILEVAVAILEGGTVHLAFHALLDPGISITPWVTRLTGITDALVAGRQRFADFNSVLMPHTSLTVGRLKCHALEGGRQHLDGGGMFGVVPKPLWQRRIPADDRNRIPLALRCLLIEHGDGLVLVDTGLGNKEDDKFRDIYGVVNQGKHGPTQIEDALAELRYRPDDVRWVINTHLHFDHAGGNTYREAADQAPDGPTVPPSDRPTKLSFPKATY